MLNIPVPPARGELRSLRPRGDGRQGNPGLAAAPAVALLSSGARTAAARPCEAGGWTAGRPALPPPAVVASAASTSREM